MPTRALQEHTWDGQPRRSAKQHEKYLCRLDSRDWNMVHTSSTFIHRGTANTWAWWSTGCPFHANRVFGKVTISKQKLKNNYITWILQTKISTLHKFSPFPVNPKFIAPHRIAGDGQHKIFHRHLMELADSLKDGRPAPWCRGQLSNTITRPFPIYRTARSLNIDQYLKWYIHYHH